MLLNLTTKEKKIEKLINAQLISCLITKLTTKGKNYEKNKYRNNLFLIFATKLNY